MLRRISLCNMIHNHRNMFISILPKKLYHPFKMMLKSLILFLMRSYLKMNKYEHLDFIKTP